MQDKKESSQKKKKMKKTETMCSRFSFLFCFVDT